MEDHFSGQRGILLVEVVANPARSQSQCLLTALLCCSLMFLQTDDESCQSSQLDEAITENTYAHTSNSSVWRSPKIGIDASRRFSRLAGVDQGEQGCKGPLAFETRRSKGCASLSLITTCGQWPVVRALWHWHWHWQATVALGGGTLRNSAPRDPDKKSWRGRVGANQPRYSRWESGYPS